MALSAEIQIFLSFFKLSSNEIHHTYSGQLQLLGWNWSENISLMEKSRISTLSFETDEQFYQYIVSLANSNNRQEDYYPLFLQIMDIMDIENGDLDEHLSNIFLGKSIINSGCAEFHT
jgi:hypothetical protein